MDRYASRSALSCRPLSAAATAAAAALRTSQPHGPYLLCGIGPISVALAHATACILEASACPTALVLVDGAATAATNLHLYALVALARGLGTCDVAFDEASRLLQARTRIRRGSDVSMHGDSRF